MQVFSVFEVIEVVIYPESMWNEKKMKAKVAGRKKGNGIVRLSERSF